MRSMRNDITRVALAATEPEIVQNRLFLSPDGRGEGQPHPPLGPIGSATASSAL